MSEPYGPGHRAIAHDVLGRAIRELLERGFSDVTEAAHALIREGLDLLAMKHQDLDDLEVELAAVVDAAEQYFADAQPGPGHLH